MSGPEKGVLKFLQDYIFDEGMAPTIREIGEGCKIRSISKIYEVLEELELRGCIRRKPKVPRGIVVLEGGEC